MLQTSSILIIDPEPTIAGLLVEILTDAGYVAYAAPESAAALDMIACHPPALIVLDVGRTGLRGSEVIEHVRETLAPLPIVVMTTTPDAAAPLLGSAVVECLAKPFVLGDVLACVARYVQPTPAVRLSHAHD
jgi:DNA-binding response OmpR family regulator